MNCQKQRKNRLSNQRRPNFEAINERFPRNPYSRPAGIDVLEERLCLSTAYDPQVLAQSKAPISSLSKIESAVSIKDAGQVAFVGGASTGAAAYVADGPNSYNVVSSAPTSVADYGQAAPVRDASNVAVATAAVTKQPQVTAVSAVSGASPLQITVDFSQAMSPSDAQNVSNYRVAEDGAPGVTIASARYVDTVSIHRATLTIAASQTVVGGSYHVRLNGGGLHNTSGIAMAAASDELLVRVIGDRKAVMVGQQPDGTIAPVGAPLDLGGAVAPNSIAVGDFSGDGKADMVSVGPAHGILFFAGDGGKFADPVEVGLPADAAPAAVYAVDWNHDGKLDVVVASVPTPPASGAVQNSIYVLLNDGTGHFTLASGSPIPVGDANPAIAAFGNFTVAGQMQIAVAGGSSSMQAGGSGTVQIIGKLIGPGYGVIDTLTLPPDDRLRSGANPVWSIVAADLNEDGKADIITSNYGNRLSNYRGGITEFASTSTGFAPPIELNYNHLNGGAPIFAADVFHNGHLDIVTLQDRYSNSLGVQDYDVVTVLKGDGHGNLADQSGESLGRRFENLLAVGELNGDGFPDLVLAVPQLSPSDASLAGGAPNPFVGIWVLLGNGQGGFIPATPTPIALDTSDQPQTSFTFVPTAAALANLNGDNTMDVVLANPNNGNLRLLINDGNGRLQEAAQPRPNAGTGDATAAGILFDTNIPGVPQMAPALVDGGHLLADLDNDGIPDLIELGRAIEIYRGSANGRFEHVFTVHDPSGRAPMWVRVADLNRDGKPDLIVGIKDSQNDMELLLGNGDGTFAISPVQPTPTAGYTVSGATVTDVNHDGIADLVVALEPFDSTGGFSTSVTAYGVFFGDGNGHLEFNANTIITVAAPRNGIGEYSGSQSVSAPIVADFDGDGLPDLLVTGSLASSTAAAIYHNNGDGTFTASTVIPRAAGNDDVRFSLADVDGDGKPDLLGWGAILDESAPGNDTLLHVYTGDGAGHFTLQPHLTASLADPETFLPSGYTAPNIANVAIGDFNGDGALDLAVDYVANGLPSDLPLPKALTIFLGDGKGHFDAGHTIPVGSNPWDLAVSTASAIIDAGSVTLAQAGPQPLKTSSVGSFTGVAGAVLQHAVATFTDPNGAAALSNYSASVDWGDGQSDTASNISGPNANGVFTVADSHVYSTSSTGSASTGAIVTVVVRRSGMPDAAAVTDTVVFADGGQPQPVVAVAVGSFTVAAGASFSRVVATFTDPNGAVALANYSATVDWGDGQSDTASTITGPDAHGVFAVTDSHNYAQANAGRNVVVVVHRTGFPDGVPASDTIIVKELTLDLVNGVYVVSASGSSSVSAAQGLLAYGAPDVGLTVTAGTFAGQNGGAFSLNSDGSFTYSDPTGFIGFDRTRYTAADANGNYGATTVTVLSQTGGLVWKFYESMLDRAPEDQGLAFWIRQFNNGAALSQIAVNFFAGNELQTRVITDYYLQYLGRQPDQGGLSHWKAQWIATGGPEDVQAGFANSPEFTAQNGNTPTGWVAGLYEKILNRAPEQQGLEYWSGQVAQLDGMDGKSFVDDASARFAIADRILKSQERYEKIILPGWFDQFVQRQPTGGELTRYVNELTGGAPDRTVEEEIIDNAGVANDVPKPSPGAAASLPGFYYVPLVEQAPPSRQHAVAWQGATTYSSIAPSSSRPSIAAKDAVFTILGG